MKVRELIQDLLLADPDAEVYLWDVRNGPLVVHTWEFYYDDRGEETRDIVLYPV